MCSWVARETGDEWATRISICSGTARPSKTGCNVRRLNSPTILRGCSSESACRPATRSSRLAAGPRGCLDLLAALVGPAGKVVGVERSDEAVSRACQHVADQGLENVEVRVGDGRDTGLHRDAFDLVTSRLVLVNVPQPEELVAEAVAIAKPGGVVAYHEAVWPTTFDPPLDAWDRLYSIFHAYADGNGIDLFIGRRVPRLLRTHGLVDVQARPITHLYPIGDSSPNPHAGVRRQLERPLRRRQPRRC